MLDICLLYTSIKLLATSVDGVDMNGLRDLGDSLKEKPVSYTHLDVYKRQVKTLMWLAGFILRMRISATLSCII